MANCSLVNVLTRKAKKFLISLIIHSRHFRVEKKKYNNFYSTPFEKLQEKDRVKIICWEETDRSISGIGVIKTVN
ncbi:MAG: hypothetical protein LBR81_01105 [Prevotellaceae bacterium]|jgi:hypothetical protein|nr:hypothetical protein [Prevotellaceae bacterium]